MSKIYNALMGVIVGDTVGVPYEYQERYLFKCENMDGHGTHDQPKGTWSDNSSLTLATVDSIADYEEIKLNDIMNAFESWLYQGNYTAFGEVFDVESTTRLALKRYRKDHSIENCGLKDEASNGNKALARIMPVALWMQKEKSDDIISAIHSVAGLTHGHDISNACCDMYALTVKNLINGLDKKNAFHFAYEDICSRYDKDLFRGWFLQFPTIYKMDHNQIRSSGNVKDTLEAAMWCFLHTNSYKECILEAVNLGNDTNTTAAVAGGLAGLWYGSGGEKGIPFEWMEKIIRKEGINIIIGKFEQAFLKVNPK